MIHQKHPKLNKNRHYMWHSCEWAIYGTVCTDIEAKVKYLAKALHPIKVGYLDETHQKGESSALAMSITQGEHVASLTTHHAIGPHQVQRLLLDVDILLVNGNHYKASRQIVFQDDRKRASLSKKLDRLTQIDLLVEPNGTERFDFLDNSINRDKPTRIEDDIDALAKLLKEKWITQLPEVKGLVLAGGQSSRMGEDKGLIKYHGRSQRSHVAQLMSDLGLESYLSLRAESVNTEGHQVIRDTFLGLGPMGGILSAFKAYPDHTWMTVACDLPYLSKQTLAQLLEARDPSKLATCFHNSDTGFPEPLITIWEPRAYQQLLMFLAQGYACPRKVLINNDVKQIEMQHKLEMTNVNTPGERRKYGEYQKDV